MREREQKIIILSLVLGITALVFLPSLFLGFNPFWDLFYVYQNPFQKTITLALVKEAFLTFLEGNYHPLTLLSHSLDYTIWRSNPFGHHLTSYLIHLINVWLVFVLIEYLIRKWRPRFDSFPLYIAGLTALIFGIHPLRVESVVWVTERKDVLFAFFYLLTLYLFIRGRSERKRGLCRWAVLTYLGAVLCKAMAVSLPVVAIIIDYRILSPAGKKLLRTSFLRAVPFAVLAAGATLLAVLGQHRESLMAPLTPMFMLENLLQFPGVMVFYVGKTLWPFGMAPLYPIEPLAAPGYIIFSWLLLAGVLTIFCLYRKRSPSLITGLLLFLFLLLPVGGLVRVGAQVLADRFSYLPTIPLIFALSWLIIIVISHIGRLRWIIIAAVVIWIAVLSRSTISYIAFWDEPITLTRRAYQSYPRSRIIRLMMLRTYNCSAACLIEEGRYDRAIEEIQRALTIQPLFPDSYHLWAYALERAGRLEAAGEVRRKAEEVRRELGERYFNQGLFYAGREEYRRAEELFREALVFNEARVEAYYNIAVIYQRWGDLPAAAAELRKALAIYPDQPLLRRRLAGVLKAQADNTSE